MLPPGVSLNPNTGVLSGLPTTPGSYSGTITAQDHAGEEFTLAFSLVIVPAPSFVTPATLPSGQVGVTYSVPLVAQDGSPPYSNFQVTA